MDVILTYTDARRAYRIARGSDAPFTIEPFAGGASTLRSTRDSWSSHEKELLDVLEMLGLYVPGIPLEVRAMSRGSRPRKKAALVVHSTNGALPAGSFRQLIPRDIRLSRSLHDAGIRILVDCPELCVITFADEERRKASARSGGRAIGAFGHTLAFASELCGLYSCNPNSPSHAEATFKDVRPVMTAASLKEYLSRVRRICGLALARTVAEWVSDRQGSPKEVALYALLVLPPHLGGLRLERPATNVPLKLTQKELESIDHMRITPDFFWKRFLLVIEYDGSYHLTSDAVLEDKRRIVDYQDLGYVVLPATKRNFESLESTRAFIEVVIRQMSRIDGEKLTHRTNRLLRDSDFCARMRQLWSAVNRQR